MKFNKVFAAGLATGVALTTLTTKLLDAFPSSVSTGTQPETRTEIIQFVSNPAPVGVSFFPGLESQSETLRIPDQADDAINFSASLDFLPFIFPQPECTVSQTTTVVKTKHGFVRDLVRIGCFLPTLWVEIISQAGLVFPVISLLYIWLMVVFFASGNCAVIVPVYSLVYCVVIANLRFDDEQYLSGCLHLAFSVWLVHVLVQIIACLPTTVLYFNGQLALEGRRPLVNIRFGYLLTNGEEHLLRRQRVVNKKLRVRAYARLGREQQARLRMAGIRQRALSYEVFGREQQARATTQATARVAEEKARKRVLDQLRSTRLKERKISSWQESLSLDYIQRGILQLSLQGPQQQTAASHTNGIGRYEPPRPDDLDGPQSDTDDDSYGNDEDSSDDDDDSHRPHGTPVRLGYRKIRPTKTVARVPASSFRQPAVRWKLPPCFPVKESVGPPVCSGSTTPASSSQPSPKQQENPASSPSLPRPASSVSSRHGPAPISPASKAPAVKPTKPGKGKKSAACASSTDGTPPASTSEKIPLVTSAPIEKPAATPAEKSIEKASEGRSVVGGKEASPVEEREQGLGFLEGYVSRPWVVGEVDDYEDPPECQPDSDKAELDDSEVPWEFQSDHGNAEIAPSDISADCGYETDGDVAMDPELPRGRSVQVDSGHEVGSDVDMDCELSEDSDVDMDSEVPEGSDVDMDSELPVCNGPQQAPRATDDSMDMDTTQAPIATQDLSEDMDMDEDWDELVETMQRFSFAEPAAQANAAGQSQTPAPPTSAPPADPSPLPLTSALRPSQIPPVPLPNDAGHHYQPPHSSSAATSSSVVAAVPSASSSATTAASSSAPSSSASASAASSSRPATASSSFSLSAASSHSSFSASSDSRPEPPRDMCQQPVDPASPFGSTDEEREMCSRTHPAAELCQNPRCPHFSLQTPHWYVEPEMMAGLIASMEPAGSQPAQAPTLVLRPRPDLSTLDRPLSAADLPAQCSLNSCRHNQMPHWHLGRWVVTTEEQALDLLKRTNKGKGKEKREPPSEPEKHDASDKDDKGKGKEKSAPPSEPAKDQASHEDDKDEGAEDEDMGVEESAPPSQPETHEPNNENDENDEAPAPQNPSSGRAPRFNLTPRLRSILSIPTAPPPTPSSSLSNSPPTAQQDPSTLTFADLPPPCSSHSCAWTHKKHWHITSSREVLTTEKQALTALKRRLSKDSSRVTCAPPPPPPKSDSDESSDEDEDEPTPQNSGPQQPSPPAASAPPPPSSTPSDASQTRQPAHQTPILDPENDPLDAEMNAYFEIHGPYAPDPPPPTTMPGARVIRPVRSAKNRATIYRLRKGL